MAHPITKIPASNRSRDPRYRPPGRRNESGDGPASGAAHFEWPSLEKIGAIPGDVNLPAAGPSTGEPPMEFLDWAQVQLGPIRSDRPARPTDPPGRDG